MTGWMTKFFEKEEDYQAFVAQMKADEAANELPDAIHLEEVGDITLEDVRQLMLATRKDTGLDADANFYLCDKCDKLHLMLIVDRPFEENEKPKWPRLRVVK